MQQGVRILLVEDNRTNQVLAEAVLGRQGYHLDIASDGNQAITAISEGDYDLVLMDLFMPGMDGFETARRIRALDSDKARIPIIGYSAHDEQDARQRCLDAGMNDFIPKPFGAQQLLSQLERTLSR